MHTVTRTDTERIPAHVGAADTCRACLAEFGGPVEPEHSLLRLDDDTTVAIPAPWLRPAVTATYRRPSPTLAHRWHRVRTSQFADDLHAGVHRGLAVMGAVGVAFAFVVLVRGAHVAAEIVGVAR